MFKHIFAVYLEIYIFLFNLSFKCIVNLSSNLPNNTVKNKRIISDFIKFYTEIYIIKYATIKGKVHMSMPHEKIRNVDMQPDRICQYLFFKMHNMP